MTVHSFTGVTAKITVSSSLVGFVSGDFTLAIATGRYNELNKTTSTSLTRGLRTVSGTLKEGLGLSDSTLTHTSTPTKCLTSPSTMTVMVQVEQQEQTHTL